MGLREGGQAASLGERGASAACAGGGTPDASGGERVWPYLDVSGKRLEEELEALAGRSSDADVGSLSLAAVRCDWPTVELEEELCRREGTRDPI